MLESMNQPRFTCNSCVIQFKSSDLQRYHMKTEWHRYNLKRRVAQLPPITADQFAEKLQISEREQKDQQVDEFGFAVLKTLNHSHRLVAPKSRHATSSLGKHTRGREINREVANASGGTLRSTSPADSIVSKISGLTVESQETNTDFGEDTVSEYDFTSDSNYEYTSVDDESYDDEASEEDESRNSKRMESRIPLTKCIYCGTENKEVERNIKHMFHKHGLYIPERSYLVDLPGLLNFLIDAIVIENSCLCCSFQGSSLESIRAHMDSKRHCRLPYETKEEREVFAPFYDFSSLYENEGSTTVHSDSTTKIHFESQETDREQRDINANYISASVDETGLELTLPNGNRIGHRAGQRYYRQNLPLPPETDESRRTVTAADRRLISGITEKQFKKGLKKMQQEEHRAKSEDIRREVKRVNFQPHFRDEFLQ